MGAFEQLQGAGGGGKGGGGGSQRTPQEAPNTLRATSKARLVDLLGEGPIVGLADGMRSVFFDETPLQAENGEWNFQGVTVHTRNGEPDQAHIPGFPAVESTTEVSAQVKHDAPITRTINTLDADALRVTVQLPALSYQNVENGDLVGAAVEIAIDVRRSGGGWQERRRDTIQGKTTSPYQRSYRVELEGAGAWDVRVRRLSADDDTATTQNDTYWAYYTTIIDAKLNYPDSAVMGIEVDAAQFGNAIPARAYDVKGLIIQVPDNYDPETRTYSGFWSGNFKLAWTDNPAWCYHDLARKARYGAGLRNVDKWELYRIGQYCDELVPDGFGGEEPRFTFNTVMADEVDALRALHTVASAFRGMTYWGTNTVMPVADMPRDPVKLVTPANVIDGEFVYEGTALKARHSVAHVSYNDPNDGYRKSVEVVENAAALERFGYRKIDVEAIACTSRAQARRLGEWILASEEAETETVSYRCSVDHADLRPGDIIKVSDPATAGARLGGRVTVSGTQVLTLDQVPNVVHGQRWFLDVMLPNGRPERRAVAAFDGDQVRLDQPLSAEPVTAAMWILSSQAIEPRQFRVLAVSESTGEGGGLEYHVTALEHDPTKYARIELGIELEPPNYTLLPSGPVSPPYAITAQAFTYLAGGTEHQGMTISWSPSDDPRVQRYLVEVQGPADMQWRTVYTETGTSVDLRDVDPGRWMIRVRGVTGLGTASPWVSLITNVAGLLLPVPPDSVDIEVGTFSITLRPRGLYPGAMWEFWRSGVALNAGKIESNAVRLSVSTDLADTELSPGTTYYYYVRGVNAYGVSTWYPVQATTETSPDKILEVLTDQIRESHLNKALQEEIQKIGRLDNIEQEILDVLDGMDLGFDEALAEEARIRSEAIAQEQQDRAEALLQAREANEAAIEQESRLREDADGKLASRLDVVSATQEGQSALFTELQEAVARDQEAWVERTNLLQAEVDDNSARIVAQSKAVASEFEAVANQMEAISAAIGKNTAGINAEAQARVDADESLTRQVQTAQSRADSAMSAVQSEASTRANADAALGRRVDTVQSDVGVNKALIQSESKTRADGDSALATQIGAVKSELGSDIAAAFTLIETSVAGDSIVKNGLFSSGDFTSWNPTWSSLAIRERDPNSGYGAIRNAPTRYVVDFPDTGHTALRRLYSEYAPVTAGDTYTIVLDYATGGSNSDVTFRIYIGWNSDESSESYEFLQVRATKLTWSKSEPLQVTVPEGVTDARILIRRATGSIGALFIANVRAYRVDDAISKRVDAVIATANDNTSAIQSEASTRASADTALGRRVDSVQSDVGSNRSAIQSEATTRASADTALGRQITNVQAAMGESLAAAQLLMEASVQGQSLVNNGLFATGDFTGWASNTSTISVVKKNPNSGSNALRSMPSEYCAQFPATSSGQYLYAPKVPVVGGQSYNFRFSYASGGSGISGLIRLYARWYDASGTRIGLEILIEESLSTTGWRNSQVKEIKVPDDAVTAEIYPYKPVSGSPAYVTNIIAERADSAFSSSFVAKVQAGGLIGGFGLYNDSETVDAGFAVDKFWIGRTLNDRVLPFIVANGKVVIDHAMINHVDFNTLKSSSGAVVVSGNKIKAEYIEADRLSVNWGQIKNVWVENAQIGTGAVDRLKIREGSVDTLLVAGDAITVPVSSFAAGDITVSPDTVHRGLRSVWIPPNNTGSPVNIIATASYRINWSIGSNAVSRLEVFLWDATESVRLGNVSTVDDSGITNSYTAAGTISLSFRIPSNWNGKTVELAAKYQVGSLSGGTYLLSNRSIQALTVKR